jgi:hypothetical protein
VEILIELLIESFGQLVFELLGESADHSLGRRRPTNKRVAYAGCVVLGSLAGWLTTIILPEPLLVRRITGIGVLITPVVTVV